MTNRQPGLGIPRDNLAIVILDEIRSLVGLAPDLNENESDAAVLNENAIE